MRVGQSVPAASVATTGTVVVRQARRLAERSPAGRRHHKGGKSWLRLLRRNTFGPLHLVPMRADAYGPDHFVTEGQAWSQTYQLYPSGLLKAPVFCVRE